MGNSANANNHENAISQGEAVSKVIDRTYTLLRKPVSLTIGGSNEKK